MGTGGSTFRIQGPVEVIGTAGPVRLGAAKERCLLAVLAVHLGIRSARASWPRRCGASIRHGPRLTGCRTTAAAAAGAADRRPVEIVTQSAGQYHSHPLRYV
jgi:hypothetical protein